MDRTLKRAKRHSRRKGERNAKAWQRYSPDGERCRHCPHDMTTHLMSSAQPHLFRRATPEEVDDLSMTLYKHTTPDGTTVWVRRVVVARHAELVTNFCTACAEEMDADQVLCYQRGLANGEVVGVTGDDIPVAA